MLQTTGTVGGNNSVVECDLAKVEVAGSNPVSRSNIESAGPPAPRLALCTPPALRRRLRSGRSIELVDAVDCIGLAGGPQARLRATLRGAQRPLRSARCCHPRSPAPRLALCTP